MVYGIGWDVAEGTFRVSGRSTQKKVLKRVTLPGRLKRSRTCCALGTGCPLDHKEEYLKREDALGKARLPIIKTR